MRYLYIDGGARVGESIEILLDNRKELLGCDCYFFECNPKHIATLNKIKESNKNYKIIVREEALWIEDTKKEFFISNDIWGDLGCTLKPEKKESLERDNPLIVQCIDIVKFLNQLDETSYIILKLDIEGAEYEILQKMIDTGCIEKIKELHVEFHDGFFDKDSSAIKNKLRKFDVICNFNWI